GVHYPGTYIAGGYNRLRTDIAGRTVENEDLVNFPNWLFLSFRHADGEWFDLAAVRLLQYRQELDLRRGMLRRCLRFEDPAGRRSVLEERRFVSMDDMHLAALELSITAENWSGALTVRSGIDGRVINDGAALYKAFANQHLEPVSCGSIRDEGIYLRVSTLRSRRELARRSTASVSRREQGASRSGASSPKSSKSSWSRVDGSRSRKSSHSTRRAIPRSRSLGSPRRRRSRAP